MSTKRDELERDLLHVTARGLVRLAGLVDRLHGEDTAQAGRISVDVRKVREMAAHAAIEAEFLTAIEALEGEGLEAELVHTGGGIYVLFHDLDTVRGVRVGISPSEVTEGAWLVCGYLHYEDDGVTFMAEAVRGDELADTVAAIAANLRTATAARVRIPGEFVADLSGETVRFKFVPDAGYAGYFGPYAVDMETGQELPTSYDGGFWSRISDALTFDHDDQRAFASVEWEG